MVIRYAKLILTVMISVAFASGAAKEYPPSTQRLISLMHLDNRWSTFERSSDLYMGIQYLFGAPGKEKNSKTAEVFFLSANERAREAFLSANKYADTNFLPTQTEARNRFLADKLAATSAIIGKSRLYISLVYFLGEGEIKADYEKSLITAQAVLASKYAEKADRLRAYMLMDEIWHMPGCRKVIDCGECVARILTQPPSLIEVMYYEVYYRLARNFFREESGLCKAVMCLNGLLQQSDRQNASLKKDIDCLRLEAFQRLKSQKASGIDLGTDLLFKASDPEPYVAIGGDPFVGLYSDDSSSGDEEDFSSRPNGSDDSPLGCDEIKPDIQIVVRPDLPSVGSLRQLSPE